MQLDMKGYWEAEAQKAANRGRWGEAANKYFHAENITKMREALEKAIWSDRDGEYQDANVGISGLIGCLRESGQLDRFVKNVSQEHSDPLKRQQWIYFSWLIQDLVDAQEALHAAALLKRVHRSLLSEGGRSLGTLKTVVKGLIHQGESEAAFALCKVIMDEDSDDLWPKSIHDKEGKVPLKRDAEWKWITELFVDARAKGVTKEICRLYFNIHPSFIYVDREIVAALKDLGEWSVFLEDVSKATPLDVGHFLSKQLSSELLGFDKKETSELEIGLILRCYEAVGPQEYVDFYEDKRATTDWLGNLIKFWENQGDKAKAEELSYRRWEDRRRLGRKDVEIAFNLGQVAYENADKQNFRQAAETMEKGAQGEDSSGYPAGFWYQAAKLYERAGNLSKAADLYERLGRPAKANRVRGKRAFDLDEAKPFAEIFIFDSDYWQRELLEVAESSDLQIRTHTIVRLLQAPMKKQEGQTWRDWMVVRALYSAAKSRTDINGYIAALRQVEMKYRDRGRWVFAAKIFLFGGMFDEFDRLCSEEDELEVAALWYDNANMPERAAKMYDLMGQREKSVKPQTDGTKQKPQDAAEPNSDSAEEPKEGTLDQLVCSQCGAEFKPHWTVCPKCDANVKQRACRTCGEPLDPDWKRCPVCSTAVATTH